MSAPGEVEVIEDLDGLEAIESEWLDLYKNCERATPFQHPDWALPWARQFTPRGVFALSLRSSDGTLVGLAPWFRYERGRATVLTPLGGGHADHHELLSLPTFEEASTRALFRALAKLGGWDLCEFGQLPPSSPLLRIDLPRGLLETHRRGAAPCPVLSLRAGEANLAGAVPSHQLARFRKYRRRAEKLGDLRLLRADASNHDEALNHLFRLHTACWEARNEPGVARETTVRAFHREVARRAARSGMLRLYALCIGEKTVASLYGFRSKETLYCYWQGFDPSVAEISPGMLVVGSVLEDAAREGVRFVDFLRGEEPYKFRWGASSQPAYERGIARAS